MKRSERIQTERINVVVAAAIVDVASSALQ